MSTSRLVHLSDLHIGKSRATDAAVVELVDLIAMNAIEHVLISGDITDHGRGRELDFFWHVMRPIRERLTLVPGNHDRLGDDLRDALMPGRRVQVDERPGLYVVRIDSTGPHNRSWLNGQGRLRPEDIDDVEDALSAAPEGALRVVTLHHHPLPLPEDHLAERLSSHFKLPFTEELELGWELVQTLNGRCDLILHGHRHTATAHSIQTTSPRPTWLFNAGSSTALRKARVFTHRAGHCFGAPTWLGSLDALEAPSEPLNEVVESTLEFVRSLNWM